MERFLNAIKSHALALDHGLGQPRFGLVTSVDPQRYAARVALQPEGVMTGWLPIMSPWVGSGWGLVCPPAPGDQVLVVPQEGSADNGIIVAGSFSDIARPPQNAPAGEFWLVHSSGSFLKLTNDGSVHVNGDLHVAGDVYDRAGSLSRLRGHYDQHTHPGSATTPPSPQD